MIFSCLCAFLGYCNYCSCSHGLMSVYWHLLQKFIQ